MPLQKTSINSQCSQCKGEVVITNFQEGLLKGIETVSDPPYLQKVKIEHLLKHTSLITHQR